MSTNRLFPNCRQIDTRVSENPTGKKSCDTTPNGFALFPKVRFNSLVSVKFTLIPNERFKEMTTTTKAPKAKEIDATVKNAYADLAGSAKDAEIYFIRQCARDISDGRVSIRVGRDSIAQAIKDSGTAPNIRASHFDYMVTASLVLNLRGAESQGVNSILKVSARLHKLVGASEAQNEAIKAKSWDALVADIEESEDSLKDSKESADAEETADLLANAITLESVIDGLDAYLKGQSLKDLKTSELAKLESVIARLATVAKNSKVA